jgi:hypothetical protein
MNSEHTLSTIDPTADADTSQKRMVITSDARLRRWVTWVGVTGTGFLGAYFFGFMIYQTIWGESDPTNWLTKLTRTHYAALVGTPMSAVTAFCIVSLLKVTSGPIEFEAIGFKFRGASGPIVLWVFCFLSIAVAFHLLWPNVA